MEQKLWRPWIGMVGLLGLGVSHSQAVEAPHGGTLVELGRGAAQVEMVLDADEGELTAYVLDGGAGKPARTTQGVIRVDLKEGDKSYKLMMRPVPDRSKGETKWDCSEFRGTAKVLVGAEDVEGRIFFLHVEQRNFKRVPFDCKATEPASGSPSPVATPPDPQG
ncbi:MAG TPA: hypothetical protein VHE12_13705 [bacterium]|nr:hypothetical protein [bacterium]